MRPCKHCGTPTESGFWCSTECHRKEDMMGARICAAPDCTEIATAGCDPCDNPICEEHVWRGVAYGMDTTACLSCVWPWGEWE